MAAIVRFSLASKIRLFNARIFVSSNIHSSPVSKAILLNMPSLSPTMASGVIVNWNKKPGDSINPGDVLCEIQTDKAVMAFELEEEGTLAKIMSPDDGKECVVGVPIAVLAEPGEDWQTIASTFKIENNKESSGKNSMSHVAESHDKTEKAETSLKFSKALGPATRLLLQQYGLNASQIPATGPKGLLLKGDVLDFVKKQNLKPISVAPVESQPSVVKPSKPTQRKTKPAASMSDETIYHDISLSHSELETATKLLSSKVNIAHSYGSIECSTDKIRRLCEHYQSDGIQISTIDVVAKAVSTALVLCPEMCATKLNGQVVLPSSVNISVASVSEDGLHVSNIVDSPSRGIEEIGSMIRNTSDSGPMQGSFMVLNLGNSEVESCKAVISAPQCSALTVGAEHLTLDDEANISASIVISLSFDGEAIPVETASRFLKVLKGFLESPSTIVLGHHTGAVDMEIATY